MNEVTANYSAPKHPSLPRFRLTRL